MKTNPKLYSFCLFGTTLLSLISPVLAATERPENSLKKTQTTPELASIEISPTEDKLTNTVEEVVERSLTQNLPDSSKLFLDQNSFDTFTPTSKTLLAQVPTNPDGSNQNNPSYPTNYNPSYNPVTPTPTNL
ncbi:hypothetical protein, partial [Merismopedia glauca]